MSLRGVWQLQKLIVSYCDWGGSSRGISRKVEFFIDFVEMNFYGSDGVVDLRVLQGLFHGVYLAMPIYHAVYMCPGIQFEVLCHRDSVKGFGRIVPGSFYGGSLEVCKYCIVYRCPRVQHGAFMETNLPSIKESNPRIEVVTELIRGQHPHLKALYRNKNERVVCVKNMTPEDVLLHANRLRNALGRKVIKLKTRHVTKHPSVQGTWTTALKL
uniref:Large ribosomal subunit protein mL43 n=1 Tax=Chenopodium quinoa TaxID=63459 RepID=A0A803KTN1_CHEQI